jgi:transcriptional regulator with XRE-family HTH domain
MSIDDRLRAERERLGHSQDQWASVTGIHRNTQVKYEKGEGSPNVEYLAAIANIGADINFITTGEKSIYRESSPDFECPIISRIVEQLEIILNKNNQVLSPQKKAQAVVILYRLAYPSKQVNEEMVKEVIKLAE